MAAGVEEPEILRKPPLFGIREDPRRTRHVQDTYETGTSQVQASGKTRLSVSRSTTIIHRYQRQLKLTVTPV
jgi:hypothetical protein